MENEMSPEKESKDLNILNSILRSSFIVGSFCVTTRNDIDSVILEFCNEN